MDKKAALIKAKVAIKLAKQRVLEDIQRIKAAETFVKNAEYHTISLAKVRQDPEGVSPEDLFDAFRQVSAMAYKQLNLLRQSKGREDMQQDVRQTTNNVVEYIEDVYNAANLQYDPQYPTNVAARVKSQINNLRESKWAPLFKF